VAVIAQWIAQIQICHLKIFYLHWIPYESHQVILPLVRTGGEPLLRRDIEICGREFRKRGMRWSMVSMATCMIRKAYLVAQCRAWGINN